MLNAVSEHLQNLTVSAENLGFPFICFFIYTYLLLPILWLLSTQSSDVLTTNRSVEQYWVEIWKLCLLTCIYIIYSLAGWHACVCVCVSMCERACMWTRKKILVRFYIFYLCFNLVCALWLWLLKVTMKSKKYVHVLSA